MAQEYGFEYELITYKWPTWLHKQKEKQRIIWAYKILFLDVIFPLSLRKVFFSVMWSSCDPCNFIIFSTLKQVSNLAIFGSNNFFPRYFLYRWFSLMLIKLWEQTWENYMTWTWRVVRLHILHSAITTRTWMAIDFGSKLVTYLR